MSFSKEMVEFGYSGLRELKAEVKATEGAIKSTHASTKKLTRDLSNGSFAKYGKEVRMARQELTLLRKEQEQLQRQAQRQALRGAYGRIGGDLRYYGQRAGGVLGRAREGLAGAGGGALGMAATFGAPLALGAMASRGFSGTAAAARLEMEFEKLSRTIATNLLPLMNTFTNTLAGVNRIAQRGSAPGAGLGDKAVNAAVKYGPLYLGARMLGLAPSMGTMAGLGVAGGSFLAKSPASGLVAAAGAYSMYRGNQIGNMEGRVAELGGLTVNRDGNGNRTGFKWNNKFTGDEYAKYAQPFVEQLKAASSTEGKLKIISDSLDAKYKDRKMLADKQGGLSGFLRTAVGGLPEDNRDNEMQILALRRLNAQYRGGEEFTASGSDAMKFVMGAGEKRGSSDLHQELAEQVAQKMSGADEGNESTLEDVVGAVNRIGEMLQRFLP